MKEKYSKVLFRDKKDVDDYFKEQFPGAMYWGAMQPFEDRFSEAEILSTKFSKIGKNTLNRFPNLKYIVNRRDDLDNIDTHEMKSLGVDGIVIYPESTIEVADYIAHHYNNIDNPGVTTFLGYGRIAKMSEDKMNIKSKKTINSKTKEIKDILKESETIIISIPLTKLTEGYISKDLLSSLENCRNIISISNGNVFNSSDFLSYIKKSEVSLTIDIVSPDIRSDLSKLHNVNYTGYTAWNFGRDHEKFVSILKENIDAVLDNNPINIIIKGDKNNKLF